MQKSLLAIVVVLLSASALAYVDVKAPPLTLSHLDKLLRGVKSLDDVPAILPAGLRINFVLKHGIARNGERGHLVEKRVSQSSDPQAPRAILWDERSGLIVSYNGGGADQTNPQRLDIHSFDPQTKRFKLAMAQFPLAAPQQPILDGNDCTLCHGPNHRPIFAMYPDWPAFYGSDNDELTNDAVAVQKLELADYDKFRAEVAAKHPRYAPLFDGKNVEQHLGMPMHATWPYRHGLETEIDAASRAFAFRPGLRLGVLLNRMMGQATIAHLTEHQHYAEFAPLFLFNLLDCKVADVAHYQALPIVVAVGERLKQKLAFRADGLLDYRQNWALFGLTVEDFDIRYGYGNAAYKSNDASRNVMAVGYLGSYWNAYFDGSATIDELVALGIYRELATRDPSLRGLVTPNGLVRKYQQYVNRYKLDKEFFEEMDRKGEWIPIPYPTKIGRAQHRQTWHADFAKEHTNVCNALAQKLESTP